MRMNRRLAQRRKRPCRMRVMKPILHWSACAGSAGSGRRTGLFPDRVRSAVLRAGPSAGGGQVAPIHPWLCSSGAWRAFQFLWFLDHAHGEHLGGRGFLEFFAKFAGKLVKPLHAFAKFLSSIPASGLDGNRTDRRAVAVKQVVAERICTCGRGRNWAGRPLPEETADPKRRSRFVGAEDRRRG